MKIRYFMHVHFTKPLYLSISCELFLLSPFICESNLRKRSFCEGFDIYLVILSDMGFTEEFI